MADVSRACEVVAAEWKDCKEDEALFRLNAFIQKRATCVETQHQEEQEVVKEEDKGTKARRKQYDSGEIVLEQVKLVRDALAEQVGGEDSDACKRATERQKASRDTNGQVDEEAGELNGHGHGETFELDSDTQTVD